LDALDGSFLANAVVLTLIATAVGMATISGQPAGVEGIEYVVSTLHARTLTCDSPSTTWSPREIGSRSDGRCAEPTPARCSASHPAVSPSK
jgi:hypothetical protein